MKRFIRVYGSGSGSVRHPGLIAKQLANVKTSQLNYYQHHTVVSGLNNQN